MGQIAGRPRSGVRVCRPEAINDEEAQAALDEKTGEHVFILEYRVVKGEHSDPKKRKEASIERRAKRYKVGKLLQDIHALTQLSGLARVGAPDGDFPDHQPPG